MRYRLLATFAGSVVISSVVLAQQSIRQPPWSPKNLQFFQQDITREVLIQRMREFSFALNVVATAFRSMGWISHRMKSPRNSRRGRC
jgi:hypothetical protein